MNRVLLLLSHFSRVRLFVTPWTVAYQALPSMGFSRSGLPFPSPGDLPNPGIKPRSPSLQADSLPSEPPGKPYLSVAAFSFWLYDQFSFCCMIITVFDFLFSFWWTNLGLLWIIMNYEYSCGVLLSHYDDFSCCGVWALECVGWEVVAHERA